MAACDYVVAGPSMGDVTKCTVYDCGMRAAGAKVLATRLLPHLPNLAVITAAGNPEIGDEGVEAVVMALEEHCPNLEWAYFYGNGMTDVGFGVLCKHLPAAKLEQLKVKGNAITTIAASFRRFDKLTAFVAHDNPWSCGWVCEEEQSEMDWEVSANNAASALAWAAALEDPDDTEIMVKPACGED